MKTQDRVARNLSLVHSLELRGMSEDARKARNREFQQQYQQLKMRQQKEAEQLREVQLLKIRHMSEQMEMELLSATDLEDLAAQHRMREDSLLAEQVMERASEASKLDRQQAQLMALQLQEEQKLVKGGLLHNQARQRKQLERSQKSSARQRERIMVDETATMLAEVGQKAAGSGGDEGSQRASDLDASEIQTSYLGTSEGGDFMGSGQDMSGVPSGAQETEADTERRRKQRTTNDAAAELKESLEKGLQRLQNVEKQHKKMFDSIRSQHKDQFLQKLREVKRKQSQLLKDQEDEVQTIRKEQVADMEELFEILKQAQDLNSQHTIGQGTERINVGNAMPGSFFESIKSGYTPSPVTYSHACVIRTAISGFKLLNPKQMMTIIQRLSVAVDATMPKFPTICKVENIGEGYLLCAGLNSDTPEDEEMDETDIVQRDVAGALECVQALRAAVEEIDVSDLNLPDGKLALKVGVTQGPVMAGLLGSRVPHFRILGATVDRATNICTAAEPAGILVSGSVKDLLANEKYSFKAHKEPDTFWFADSS
ncbi:nucleotide cyclase [Powellomyces hirtus]|nr:nucleotide cyclase [Powellomyces hirtus]